MQAAGRWRAPAVPALVATSRTAMATVFPVALSDSVGGRDIVRPIM